jgi:hypothetical protein
MADESFPVLILAVLIPISFVDPGYVAFAIAKKCCGGASAQSHEPNGYRLCGRLQFQSHQHVALVRQKWTHMCCPTWHFPSAGYPG